jgi:hypothetical protein
MDDKTGVISWNSQLEKVISDEGERCLCYSWLHDRAEKRYSSFSTQLTLPSIVLATISGSASIGIGQFIPDPKIGNTVIGMFTLTVAILTTVSSYFAWAKRSESHRIAAISYKKTYRFILIELALARSERMTAKDMLKVVRDEAQRLAEISPQIPDPIIDDFKKKFGESTPEVTKPEITNGLDPIYVYPSDLDSPLIGGIKGKISEALLDPMYRSPRPSILIPGEGVVTVKQPILNPLKTSTDDRTQGTSQTSSSVRLPTVSEADNNHTSIPSYTLNSTSQ